MQATFYRYHPRAVFKRYMHDETQHHMEQSACVALRQRAFTFHIVRAKNPRDQIFK